MKLLTPVILPPTDIKIDTTSRVVLIGSCFAENVGRQLQIELGEDRVEVNPFGVQYNPLSIVRTLNIMLDNEAPDSEVFLGRDGLWHSWLHTSHFSATTEEECRRKIRERFVSARESLKTADVIIFTFGTTRYYELVDTKKIVSNCHKEPAKLFVEKEPTFDEMKKSLFDLIERLVLFNKKAHIIMTNSPFRYAKYGFHESQLQKARLLLLIDNLKEWCEYFPSYEIMLDELRDYRFYANDMLHPSEQAVEYIMECFRDWCYTDALKIQAIEKQKEYKRGLHRAINK